MAATKISALTTDSAPHRTNDYAPTYDASAVATKKVALWDFGSFEIDAGCTNNNLADSTTYYFGGMRGTSLQTTVNLARLYVMRAGIITTAFVTCFTSGTLGSAENASLYIRKNNTTDTLISSAITFNAVTTAFGSFSPNVTFAFGDYFEIKLVTPAFATNPTAVYINVQLLMQ